MPETSKPQVPYLGEASETAPVAPVAPVALVAAPSNSSWMQAAPTQVSSASAGWAAKASAAAAPADSRILRVTKFILVRLDGNSGASKVEPLRMGHMTAKIARVQRKHDERRRARCETSQGAGLT